MTPEFLREGNAVADVLGPDRIVLGGIDDRTQDAVAELYAPFAADTIRTNPATAEMIEYTANSLLASYLEAGCGFGGGCLPKDVKALVAFGRDVGSPMRVLESVMGVNEGQPAQMLRLGREPIPVRSVDPSQSPHGEQAGERMPGPWRTGVPGRRAQKRKWFQVLSRSYQR